MPCKQAGLPIAEIFLRPVSVESVACLSREW